MRLRSTRLTAIASAARRLFNPKDLFANGEQGAWYDPSDMSTLFQDAAGTTPVTAVEQPVGRMLDKSGRGNHATQSTAINRPVLSARYNLLTKTEQFADSVWVKYTTGASSVQVTENFGISPDGSQTAARLQMTASGGFAELFQRPLVPVSTPLKASIWMRSLSGTKSTTVSGSNPYSQLVTVTEQWQEFSITSVATSGIFGIDLIAGGIDGASTSLDLLIWHPDLRVANDGVDLPAYQRVNTSTDYDTAGFPMYLRFDGVDDWLVTPSINFTGTDKMTVFAGVRRLRDGSFPIIAELSTSSFSINGTFGLFANASPGRYSVGVRASAQYDKETLSVFASPISSVITITSDFAGAPNEQSAMRINGVSQSLSVMVGTNAGTGNYGNHPLYIGSRGAGGLQFNGHIYSLIVRGAQSSTEQITQTETWVNGKTRAWA